MPQENALDLQGLNLSADALKSLFEVDREAWLKEADELESYFALFGDHFPTTLQNEITQLRHRLTQT